MTVRFGGPQSDNQYLDIRELRTPAITRNVVKFYPWISIGFFICSLIMLWNIAIEILPPILGVTGMLLWVQRQLRQNVTSIRPSSKNLQILPQKETSTIGLVRKNQYLSAHSPWNIFVSSKNNRKIATIFSTQNRAIIVPRAFFSSHDDWREIISLVADNVNAHP